MLWKSFVRNKKAKAPLSWGNLRVRRLVKSSITISIKIPNLYHLIPYYATSIWSIRWMEQWQKNYTPRNTRIIFCEWKRNMVYETRNQYRKWIKWKKRLQETSTHPQKSRKYVLHCTDDNEMKRKSVLLWDKKLWISPWLLHTNCATSSALSSSYYR